jgi:hypothetical protein
MGLTRETRTVDLVFPTAGSPTFNFLDFENPCGTLDFSDGGVAVSLSYNTKIRCFDNVLGLGPAPTG